MSKTKITIITLLVALLFGAALYLGQSQKRVLVVHSFNSSSIWVKQINHGIDTYLKNNLGFSDTIHVEYYYMDMEYSSRQKCEAYLTEIRNAEKIIEDHEPDIIILVDDIAQRLIGLRLAKYRYSGGDYLKHNAEWLVKNGNCSNKQDIKGNVVSEMYSLSLARHPDIIFAGVDSDAEEYGYSNALNVTGIFEHQYMESVMETLQDLYRAIPEADEKPASVIVLGISSGMADGEKDRIQSDLLSLEFDVPLKWGEFVEVSSAEEWKKAVLQANKDKAMIFVAGRTDEDTVKWTEACAQYPALGGSVSYILDGGMLSNTASGQEQGETAMELARQVLDGIDTAKIERREPRQFTVGMNEALFDRRGLLGFPLIYESFSREAESYRYFDYDYRTDCK